MTKRPELLYDFFYIHICADYYVTSSASSQVIDSNGYKTAFSVYLRTFKKLLTYVIYCSVCRFPGLSHLQVVQYFPKIFMWGEGGLV